MVITLTHDCDVERRPVPLAFNGDFRDCCMDEIAPDTAHNQFQFHPGVFGSKGEEYEHRALLYFDLKAFIPANATITAAVWWFYVASTDITGQAFRAVRCRRQDWLEDEATWNSYKTGSAWTSPGASDTDTDRDPGVVDELGNLPNATWYSLSLINLVSDAWDNQDGICTFIMERYDDMLSLANVTIEAKNYYAADPTLVHQLRITYTLADRTFQALVR